MRAGVAGLLFFWATATVASGELTFSKTENSIEIAVHGKHFASYRFNDPAVRRPYICNVTAPDGTPITRPYPTVPDEDHGTMHPGIWLAFGDINGHDFWRNKSWIKHDGMIAEPRLTDERSGGFSVRNRYETESAETLLNEECRIEFHVQEDTVVINWRSVFLPELPQVTFGDQEEMGLGFRLASNLTVDSGSGTIANDRGLRNGDGVWGKTAAWCDYSGALSGNTYGIAVIPSPENFRASWMHARDYGLLVANPFGRNAMTGGPASAITLEENKPLALEFSLVIHFGKPMDTRYLDTFAAAKGER